MPVRESMGVSLVGRNVLLDNVKKGILFKQPLGEYQQRMESRVIGKENRCLIGKESRKERTQSRLLAGPSEPLLYPHQPPCHR